MRGLEMNGNAAGECDLVSLGGRFVSPTGVLYKSTQQSLVYQASKQRKK